MCLQKCHNGDDTSVLKSPWHAGTTITTCEEFDVCQLHVAQGWKYLFCILICRSNGGMGKLLEIHRTHRNYGQAV